MGLRNFPNETNRTSTVRFLPLVRFSYPRRTFFRRNLSGINIRKITQDFHRCSFFSFRNKSDKGETQERWVLRFFVRSMRPFLFEIVPTRSSGYVVFRFEVRYVASRRERRLVLKAIPRGKETRTVSRNARTKYELRSIRER